MQMGVNGYKPGAPEFCQPASIYQLLENKKTAHTNCTGNPVAGVTQLK